MTPKKGYWMALVDVTDPDGYARYIAANKAAFEKYGAKFVVRAGQGQVMEGPAANRWVVIEFKDYQTAVDCFHSPEYRAAYEMRQAFANAHMAIVEGV